MVTFIWIEIVYEDLKLMVLPLLKASHKNIITSMQMIGIRYFLDWNLKVSELDIFLNPFFITFM